MSDGPSVQFIAAVSSVGASGVVVGIYAFYHAIIRGKGVWRKAIEDEAALKGGLIDKKSIVIGVFPPTITVFASFAAFTFAGVMVVIGILIVGPGAGSGNELALHKLVVVYIALGAAAVASLLWMVGLDLVMQALTPTIQLQENRMFAMYKLWSNLWMLGAGLVAVALGLLMVVVNPITAMVVAFFGCLVYLKYTKTVNNW